MKKLKIKPGKDSSVIRGHPWLFSGALENQKETVSEGEWVQVLSSNGDYLATGYYSAGASIAVRICSRNAALMPEEIISEHISKAISLRMNLDLPSAQTNMFRLVHGEGDQLAGLIIDVYGSVAVLQCHTAGMHGYRATIADFLTSQKEIPIATVFDKSSETLKSTVIRSTENGYLIGKYTQEQLFENGHPFKVDWEQGQKTGFFLDQRENRKLLQKYAVNRKVLNTFCYTGGFSIYALLAGAREVHSLDSSASALRMTEENVALTEKSGVHQIVKADAVQHIRSIDHDYDLIILDPPAFAKNVHSKHNALQAYKRLNQAAMERIAPDGIIFTFSCSQAVDQEQFKGMVTAAGIGAGRSIRILDRLHQPHDHPVDLFHPEGEYLKGLVLHIA